MIHHPPTAIIRFDRPLTQEEVAQVLGVTRGVVSQVERRALRKMRHALASKGVCVAEALKFPAKMTLGERFTQTEGE